MILLMGFFADVFLGPKCIFCGERSLRSFWEIGLPGRTQIQLLYCSSCNRAGVYNFVPKCYLCGERQTIVGRNESDAPVPKCPNCGHLWDCDDEEKYK